MKIKSLAAKNFRTLQDIKIEFSSSYCTISGHNNAGKSNVIRLILCLLGEDQSDVFFVLPKEQDISYSDDVTQWLEKGNTIKVDYVLSASRADDPALVTFIEKLTEQKLEQEEIEIHIEHIIESKNKNETKILINGEMADSVAVNEILRRLKTANNLFLYNSAHNIRNVFYRQGKIASVFEFHLSPADRDAISTAEKTLQSKIRKLAKVHKGDLENMLGRLSDTYDVGFSSFDSASSQKIPLSINLKDKSVEVPLSDWGSGTQNKTQILLAILHANRIKTKEKSEDRITPIVLIEEPESFLHPSAQAEFGRVLQCFATEMGIQIICATHSPYMLNQTEPSANILLRRHKQRNKLKETLLVPAGGDEWMAPFAEHLGLVPSEFRAWGHSFLSTGQKVVLVEGDIDVEYFEHIRKTWPDKVGIPDDVEFSGYGGKDTLKNTTLVKFVLRKISNVFVTFDLDSKDEIEKFLTRLALEPKKHYLPIGIDKAGKRAIEGILPDCVLSAVHSRETELMMKLQDNTERRKAKEELKKLYLKEFKNASDYSDAEMKEIFRVCNTIGRAMTNR